MCEGFLAWLCMQFDYLVREKIADGPLIAKWRKPGYEILCSMLAIQKVRCIPGMLFLAGTLLAYLKACWFASGKLRQARPLGGILPPHLPGDNGQHQHTWPAPVPPCAHRATTTSTPPPIAVCRSSFAAHSSGLPQTCRPGASRVHQATGGLGVQCGGTHPLRMMAQVGKEQIQWGKLSTCSNFGCKYTCQA